MTRVRDTDIKHNLKIYFELLSKYKKGFIGLLIAILVIEASRVVPKLLFKVFIDEGTKFADNLIPKQIFIELLMSLALIFILITFVKTLTHWIKINLINNLNAGLIRDLKTKFFNHILNLSYTFHISNKTGSLIARLIRGGSAVERMTDVLVFNTFPLLFQLVIVSLSLLYFDALSALVVFSTVVIFILYSMVILHFQMKYKLIANVIEDTEKANVNDFFTNIESIKYFGKEPSIITKFKKLSGNTSNALLRFWNYYRWMDAGQSLIIGTGTLFLLYFPITRFLEGELTIGTLVFIYTIYGNLFGPLFGFIHGIRGFYRSMADFESLFQYGKIERDVQDMTHSRKLKVKKGEIEFKNVTFKYHKRRIFTNFNLKIERNTKVALVGHSGSGKSTLIKLLYRFYNLNEGQILIDGRDINDYKQESLRSELSIVPQECVLFDDTIYNNIKFSKPAAKRKEVKNAIKFSQLDKIIPLFPEKEKTIVGERGVKLSGGEKQRVSIARALLANKKILVLDEATSSLDSETEHEIQKDLKKLMQGRTSIIIAHRLSTIMNADKIIVLEKGKIVQEGTHKQLIRRKGVYKKLWNLQKGGYIK